MDESHENLKSKDALKILEMEARDGARAEGLGGQSLGFKI